MLKPTSLYDDFVSIRNQDCTADLTIPVVILPEQNDEQASRHCRESIKLDIPWLCEKPAHDRIAVICGSSPSLSKHYGDIRCLQRDGADIFACNTAAKFLHHNKVYVNYQVLLDGSLLTLPAIFPEAECHLLASILPPVFFERCKNIILWHPCIKAVEAVVEGLPRDFAYIGGGISVTMFALCIAWTLGYRRIECFGIDSSFEGPHFHVNDSSPVSDFIVEVDFNGKLYRTSYDMKAQVVVFLQLERKLLEAGTIVNVHGTGLLPDAFAAAVAKRTCSSCGQLRGHYDDCEVGLSSPITV